MSKLLRGFLGFVLIINLSILVVLSAINLYGLYHGTRVFEVPLFGIFLFNSFFYSVGGVVLFAAYRRTISAIFNESKMLFPSWVLLSIFYPLFGLLEDIYFSHHPEILKPLTGSAYVLFVQFSAMFFSLLLTLAVVKLLQPTWSQVRMFV